jgi:predicted type IV restriction endonuclease
MNAEQLLNLAKFFHEHRDFITNEETAKMSLVVPFLKLLGYDFNSPREVRVEYTAAFTQGDGKRLPDRMDFAIFDKSGNKPLMVIETKPLGIILRSKAQQLARYIAQLPELHFGIMTDGCTYDFYGDLESPNVMDSNPFFSFSLDDPKTDWAKVASFLSKFSRDVFNAETLVTDAENSRYRQAMVDKLARVLRAPGKDDDFMKWLTADVYSGKRTASVMARMAEIAKDAIEPALLRVMGDEFVEKLKERIHAAQPLDTDQSSDALMDDEIPLGEQAQAPDSESSESLRKGLITTQQELDVYEIVKALCLHAGYDEAQILLRDTVNYCNISFGRPTKWFIRFFGDSRRLNITTLVPTSQAREAAPDFDVEDSPQVFGVSRIYFDNIDQLRALEIVILQSLNILLRLPNKEDKSESNAHELSKSDCEKGSEDG